MKGNGFAINDEPKDDAAAWYVANQTRKGEVDEETIRLWGEWFDVPKNRARYESIVAMSQIASQLPRPSAAREDELFRDLARIDLPAQPELTLSPSALGLSSASLRFRKLAAVAGVALSLTLIGLALLLNSRSAAPGRIYSTASGEQLEFTLEDGSSITLGGDTSIEVRFGPSGRMVVLSRGEGMFRVQHEADRPFRVCTASGCTTAVGTIFDVRMYSNHTRVWVQEGAVMVMAQETNDKYRNSARGPVDGLPMRLAPGESVNYNADGKISNQMVLDPFAAAGWTSGSLVYFGRPLGEVLEDVQRYTSRKLSVDLHEAHLLYSGSVLQQHIEPWIRGLPLVFPVAVVDCHNLQESIDNDTAGVVRACASNPDQILIRAR